MTARKVRWAANRPNGDPIIINGVVADVDDETGAVSLDARTLAVVAEVAARTPHTVTMMIVPMLDFADEVHHIVEERHAPAQPVGNAGTPILKPPIEAAPLSEQTQEMIDAILRLMYSQMYRYQLKSVGTVPSVVSVQELRNGPLGRDLLTLVRIAGGEVEGTTDEVINAVDSVLELLFWPPSKDFYVVPRAFWEEPLGIMLSQAILQKLDPTDVLSVNDVAAMLGVTRALVYRWIDERILRAVRDPQSGQMLVLKHDVQALHDEAEHYADDFSEGNAEEEPVQPKVIVLRARQRPKQREAGEPTASLFG